MQKSWDLQITDVPCRFIRRNRTVQLPNCWNGKVCVQCHVHSAYKLLIIHSNRRVLLSYPTWCFCLHPPILGPTTQYQSQCQSQQGTPVAHALHPSAKPPIPGRQHAAFVGYVGLLPFLFFLS